MNDTEPLTTVKGSFAEVRADTPLTAIERRGREVRARRRRGLAAWTVTEKPPGIIEIKIRELKDPVGLQRGLRSDGIPAFVRFQNQNLPGCLNLPPVTRRGQQLSQKIFPEPDNAQEADNVAMVIDAAAIPPGVGLWIEFTPPLTQNEGNGRSVVSFGTGYMLVCASGHCPLGG